MPTTVTNTRLREHDVVLWERARYRVAFVNESRAHLVSVDRNTRVFTPATGVNAGKERKFEEPLRPVDVSPNAELPVVGRWDPEKEEVV